MKIFIFNFNGQGYKNDFCGQRLRAVYTSDNKTAVLHNNAIFRTNFGGNRHHDRGDIYI